MRQGDGIMEREAWNRTRLLVQFLVWYESAHSSMFFMLPKILVMSAKYCIFGPLNSHLLNL
jgi:hypothetical protein